MAKVFTHEKYESTAQGNYTAIQPAIVELPEYMIIDGQYYDKSSLSPIPFKFLKFPGRDNYMTGRVMWMDDEIQSSDAHMNGSSIYAVRPSDGSTYGPQMIIDSEDSNIAWWTSLGNYNASQVWHKINLSTKTKVSDYYSEGDNIEGFSYMHMVDQTADYVLTIAQNFRTTYCSSKLGYINKASLNIGQIDPGTSNAKYARAQYLCSSSDYVFSFNQYMYTDTNVMYISKHDKTAPNTAGLASSNYTVPSASSNHGWSILSQALASGIDNDTFYGFHPSANSDDAYNPFLITVQKNLGTASLDATTVTMDFTTAGTTRSAVFTKGSGLTAFGRERLETWIVNGSSYDYVCLALTESTRYSNEGAEAFKIYIFKINPNDKKNLIYVNTVDPTTRMRGCFPIEDDFTKLGVIHDGGMRIYSWNNGTETYDYVQDYSAPPKSVVRDALERIWILDTNDDVHMFSATTPTTVSVAMAASSYDYQGSNISTSCDVSAWNSDSERVVADVKLVLEGSLYFADNSQSKTITTSASAETNVSLVIKGSSYSRIVSSVVL